MFQVDGSVTTVLNLTLDAVMFARCWNETHPLLGLAGETETRACMYILPQPKMHEQAEQTLVACGSPASAESEPWHRRLAHISSHELVSVHKYADGVLKLGPLAHGLSDMSAWEAHKLHFAGHFHPA